MEAPKKFYRIFSLIENTIVVLDIENNWFESEQEAEKHINQNYQDENNTPSLMLTVLPVWSVK